MATRHGTPANSGDKKEIDPAQMAKKVAARIDAYTSIKAPEPIRAAVSDFAREVVRKAGPASDEVAGTWMTAVAGLARWARSKGLGLEAEVLLSRDTVIRYVADRYGSAPTGNAVRSSLESVGRRVVPHRWPTEGPKMRRQRAAEPYTAEQIDAYLALAAAQSTKLRRRRLEALICLTAGAGLTPGDLRHLRAEHVRRHGGGVVVDVVAGSAPRVVPVLPDYAQRLITIAEAAAADELLIGGRDPERRMVTGPLVSRLNGGGDLEPLVVSRLTSTWRTTVLDRIGLKAVLAAAGIKSTNTLVDLCARLPEPTLEQIQEVVG